MYVDTEVANEDHIVSINTSLFWVISSIFQDSEVTVDFLQTIKHRMWLFEYVFSNDR